MKNYNQTFSQSVNREVRQAMTNEAQTVRVKPSENRYIWLIVGIITLTTIGLSLAGIVTNN